jgi:hypothetical protein
MAVAEPAQQVRVRTVESSRSAPRIPSGQERDVTSDSSSFLKQLLVLGLVALSVWVAYKVATGKYYTPRSNFGFYLGVVGSLMMFALLSYPLRKHVRFMHSWGPLKYWFRWHMVLGILGPTLILFHSTFHLRSLNATIALMSMLIVVISGVIGRFVYTKIHYGLYGSRATLERVQQEFAGRSESMKSRFHMVPRVEEWLKSFERRANQVERSFITMSWHLFALGWKRRLCMFRCTMELRAVLRGRQHPEFRAGAPEAIRLAKRYLMEAERVAEFTTYERLFSLWHVLHIPLIYLLAASTIFHILAVYMY